MHGETSRCPALTWGGRGDDAPKAAVLSEGTPVWGREVDLLGWQVVYKSLAHEGAMF